MMILILSLLLISLSFIMFFINHPLAMGLIILMQTLIISIFIGMFMSTYWFSYILFMVFMGGLLVLFIYVSSIASNELMKFTLKLKLMFLFIMMSTMTISYLKYNNINLTYLFKNKEMNNMINLIYFSNENNINLFKLYNKQNYFLIMLLILYLFVTLIAVIKITNIFYGPLRSFN
nr:NADH dehydrogenase subunit 6 [Eurema hecabe]